MESLLAGYFGRKREKAFPANFGLESSTVLKGTTAV